MVGRVLVTGASGFLGGCLTRMLVEAGCEVRALTREGVSPSLDGVEVERVVADVAQARELMKAMEGIEEVYHCDARVSAWARMESALHQINVTGTRNLCRAMMETGAPRMVYASSVEAIGVTADGTPANEGQAWAASPDVAAYTATRHQGELIARDYANSGGEVVIVNPTYMLGPGDHELISGRLVLEVATRRATGFPSGGLNVVDVRDVCVGMIRAMERGKAGRRYILGGHNVTYEELFALIAEVAGRPRPRVRVPRPVALAAGALGDLWGGVTGREPTVSRVLARYVGVESYYDSSRARDELDLPRTPLRQTIQDTLEWFREHPEAS